MLGGVRHGVNLTRLREKNYRIPDKGATGLQWAGFAIGMRSKRIEKSIRFGAWSTETFGRFGRIFRFNFRSRARSSSEAVESNRNSVCLTSVLSNEIRKKTASRGHGVSEN